LKSDGASNALEVAVRQDDAMRVREVLARFPSLRDHLDDAMPHAGFGETPLIAAANQENRDMVDVLLDAGADITQRSHWWAGSFGLFGDNPELNEHLVSRGAVVDAHDASRLGMFDRLRAIVATDPNVVNARFGDGQTPLHVASSVGIATFLIDNGAEIDALDADHESTPAQYLVREHQEVVRLLISRGCRTDILMAAAVGDMELVRRKLAADPMSVATAVSSRYFPMKDSRAGGTIYIWTLGRGKLAHDVAREFAHEDIADLLMQHTPAPLKLALACEAGDDAAVEKLLGDHPDIAREIGGDLEKRLLAAADAGNSRAVDLMLSAGWSASASDERGVTALHWAAFHGNAALVRTLIRHGADVNVRERTFGGTPAGWAEHGAQNRWNSDSGDYPAVLEALAAASGG
jgi:ankyrin repeat protein